MGFEGENGCSPPNIVMLVLDTARARNFSCYGNERETTPTLDALASRGVKFSRATSISPWTLPSHASLFTGVPPTVHQTNSLESQLPSSLTTLASMLSAHGYNTIGMSANPWFSSQFGIIDGFDHFHHLFGPFSTESYREFVMKVTDSGNSLPERVSSILSSQSPLEIARNGMTAAYRQFVDRDDDGARKAVNKAHEVIGQSNPYFMFINFLEPHLPFEPPEDCRRKFIPDHVTENRLELLNQDATAYNIRNVEMEQSDFDFLERLYDAEIFHVDRQICRILDYLDQTGQRDNTIIIVLGDHGENIGDHGLMAHHYSIHETLTHIPLIIHYPGVFDGGDIIESRVSSLDVPATLVEILSDYGINDDSFQAQQKGTPLHYESLTERTIVSEYLNPMPPISRLREKSENGDFDVSQYDRQLRAVYDDEYKLVRGTDGYQALYDLSENPHESKNIIETSPLKSTELEEMLDKWVKSIQPECASLTDSTNEQLEDRLSNLGYL
ncbi:sulfatase [Halorarius halobius]|uniref:sulfatase n=1 Tax=Halorarius halobius TaxID=2962671 RepID=UPI0020CC2D8D|nr:sulfatase [Halorarius halobius]